MNHKTLTENLNTAWLGHPTIFFESTDSTNVRAASLVADEAKNHHGTAIIAAQQTAGRGTGIAKWISDNPDGLLLTFILKHPLRKEPIQFVPAIAAVEMLKSDFGVSAHVKWPNDILYQDKKLGGILCERRGDYYIIGLGLNINQEVFSEEIKNKAVSVYHLTGKKNSIEHVFKSIMRRFENLYDSPADLIQRWKANSLMIGKTIGVTQNQTEKLAVTVTNITAEGYLQVADMQGNLHTWISSSDLDIDTNY